MYRYTTLLLLVAGHDACPTLISAHIVLKTKANQRRPSMELLNYRNNRVKIKMPDFSSIPNVLITIAIIYGDEHIVVEDGNGVIFGASSDHAVWSGGFDGAYVVYARDGIGKDPEIDLLSDPKWQARKDSYEFLYAAYDAAFHELME